MHAPSEHVSDTKAPAPVSPENGGGSFEFSDQRPEMAAQRKLKAMAEAYTPVIQLKKTDKLTPGKMNVVGENHGISIPRRPEEHRVAEAHGLHLREENMLFLPAKGAAKGFVYGDPPWLRGINRTYRVLIGTELFLAALRSKDQSIGGLHQKLVGELSASFRERMPEWWANRENLYKGAVCNDEGKNKQAMEYSFYIIDQCLVTSRQLTNLYNTSNNPKLPLIAINPLLTGIKTYEVKTARFDFNGWDHVLTELNKLYDTHIAPNYGRGTKAFDMVSERRSDFMHVFAQEFAEKPILWKVGDMHVQEIDKKYSQEALYSYMDMQEFNRQYFSPGAAASAAGAGSGAAAPLNAQQPIASAGSASGAAATGNPMASAVLKIPVSDSGAAAPLNTQQPTASGGSASGAAATGNPMASAVLKIPVSDSGAAAPTPVKPVPQQTVTASGAVRSKRDSGTSIPIVTGAAAPRPVKSTVTASGAVRRK